MKWLPLFLTATLSCGVFANESDVLTGQGVGFALVVVEKCTGTAPQPGYFQAIYMGMTNNGVSGEDFKRGFTSGAWKAEAQFPGKPSANECKEAKMMKVRLDKSLRL